GRKATGASRWTFLPRSATSKVDAGYRRRAAILTTDDDREAGSASSRMHRDFVDGPRVVRRTDSELRDANVTRQMGGDDDLHEIQPSASAERRIRYVVDRELELVVDRRLGALGCEPDLADAADRAKIELERFGTALRRSGRPLGR